MDIIIGTRMIKGKSDYTMTRLGWLNMEREPLQLQLTVRWMIGLVSHGVALLFYIIGFSTLGWTQGTFLDQNLQVGLWTICLDDACSTWVDPRVRVEVGDWIKIVQTFAVFGFLLLSVQLVISLFYTISRACGTVKSRRLIQLSSVVVSVAVLFIGFSTFMFDYKMTKNYINGPGAEGSDLHLGFSFHLSWLSCVIGAVSAGLYMYEFISQPRIHGEYITLE